MIIRLRISPTYCYEDVDIFKRFNKKNKFDVSDLYDSFSPILIIRTKNERNEFISSYFYSLYLLHLFRFHYLNRYIYECNFKLWDRLHTELRI